MKKQSIAIRVDLDKTNERLAEVQPDLDAKKNRIEELRQSYVNKKASFEDLQAEQNILTLMARTIDELQSKAVNLQRQYNEAVAAEDRQNIFVQMKSDVETAEKCFEEYTRARVAAGVAILKLTRARVRFIEAQLSFADRFRSALPEKIDNILHPPKTLRVAYAAVRQESIEAGISEDEFNFLTNPIQSPPVTCEPAVIAAEQTAMNLRNQERMAEVSRKRDQAAAHAGEVQRSAQEAFDKERRERAKAVRHRGPVSMGQ